MAKFIEVKGNIVGLGFPARNEMIPGLVSKGRRCRTERMESHGLGVRSSVGRSQK